MYRPCNRVLLGILLAAMAALLVGSCTDETAPGPILHGRFAIQPFFSTAAAGIVPLSQARFLVVRIGDNSVAADTVLALAPDQDSVDLALTVPLLQDGETVEVTITLITPAGDTAFRAGPLLVSPSTSGPPVLIDAEFTYEGPGASAVSVDIADPPAGILFIGETIRLTATAFDDGDNPIPNTPFRWETLNPLIASVANIDAAFVATVLAESMRGDAQIVVTSPTDLTDTVTVSVQPLPNGIAVESGNGQSGTVGTALPQPLTARVTATDGLGVSGVWVLFSVAGGGGTLSVDSALADTSGFASASLTLGLVAGVHTVVASTAMLPATTATFTADALAGPPQNITLSAGDAQTAAAGTAVATAPAVLVTDANGNPISGVSVTFEVVSGGGSITGALPNTDASGTATLSSWTLGTVPGSNVLRAFLTGFGLGADPGPKARGRTPAQTAAPTDTVTLAGPKGRGRTPNQTAAPTDTVTFTANGVTTPPATVVLVSGDTQIGTVGAVLTASLVARVEDALGNPLPAVTVNWVVTLGTGSVDAVAVVTDAAGLAAVAWTLGTAAGTGHSVTASVSGVVPTAVYTATALPGPPAALAFVTQPSDTLRSAIIAPPVEVEILDQFANRVTADSVTGVDITITAGTGTVGAVLSGTTTQTAVGGLVTFADLSINLAGTAYTLDATIPSLALATSAPFDINAPPSPPAVLISHWAADGNPVDSADGNDGTLVGGTAFAPGLINQAFAFDGVDDLVNIGNPANLQLSAGTFSVSVWAFANVANVDMSFVDRMSGINEDGWRMAQQFQNNEVWFCLGGGTGVNGCQTGAATTVQTGSINVGAWSHLVTVKSGDSIAIYLNGQLAQQKALPPFTDNQANNLLIGSSATTGASAFMNGLLDDVRIYSGVLTATQVDSIFVAVVSAAPSKLDFTGEPVNTSVNGTMPTVEVTARDPLGNVDASFTGNVTVTILDDPSAGAAILGGTTTVPAVGGVAQFTDLTIDVIGTGYTFEATATGFDPNTSVTFDITIPPVTATISWANPVSGNWNDPTMWNTGVVPVASDVVTIDVPGAPFSVTLGASATVDGLLLGGGTSDPTLRIATSVNVAVTLTVANGMTNAGTIELTTLGGAGGSTQALNITTGYHRGGG